MKRVIRAGADELLFLPLDPGDLTRALLKVSESRVRAARHDGGMVISLASIVGGVGVSSIAVNLALALRYKLDKRVALLDLDLQTGALAVLLNLEPEFTIMPLCRLEKKLDSIQLEAALTKHPSGAVPARGAQADRRRRAGFRYHGRRGDRFHARHVRLRDRRLRTSPR